MTTCVRINLEKSVCVQIKRLLMSSEHQIAIELLQFYKCVITLTNIKYIVGEKNDQ